MTISYALGFLGAALMLASYMMKSMLPLRLVALAACICFFIYGWMELAWPSLVCYALMIPINIKKSLQVHRLVKSIQRARHDTPVADWLLPNMTRREAKAGELLWNKGDIATEMIYIESGQLRLVEHGELIGPASIVGEIGLLSPDNRRTLSIRCETDCVLYSLSAEGMAQLYYQNPKLGFHVVRLIVQRLTHDAEKARLAARAAEQPALPAAGVLQAPTA